MQAALHVRNRRGSPPLRFPALHFTAMADTAPAAEITRLLCVFGARRGWLAGQDVAPAAVRSGSQGGYLLRVRTGRNAR